MKTQKQIWKDINEPKIEKIMVAFDENGEPWITILQLDRIPIEIMKEWRQQK